MKNIRHVIDTILELAKDYASLRVEDIRSEQELFLFGISIGIGRRLTKSESRSFLRTFPTAEAIIGYERSLLRPKGRRRLYSVSLALRCWLRRERWLRPELEGRLGYGIGPSYYPLYRMDGPMQAVFAKYVRTLAKECAPPLSEEQIMELIAKLEDPLPRWLRQ